MSQGGALNSSAGGADLQRLTPDTGGAVSSVAGNINVKGVQANTGLTTPSQNIQTRNVGGEFYIEDRTFVTEYVVDASTTPGLQGTFTTVQAAVTAASANLSATTTRTATILIRVGTYTENVTFPNNTSYHLMGLCPPHPEVFAGLTTGVILSGTQTLGTTCSVTFENMEIFGVGIVAPSTARVVTTYCDISSITLTGGVGDLTDTAVTSVLTQSGASILRALSCEIELLTMSNTSRATIFNSGVSTVNVANSVEVNLSQCYGLSNMAGTTSGTVNLIDCQVNTGTPINPTATVNFSTLSEGLIGVAGSFFGSNPTPSINASTVGNVLHVRRVAGDITGGIGDYLLAVTDTAAPRAVTLPSVGVLTNQVFVIKDESGGAGIGVNNITVSVNGGVKTIDGAASQVININYGSFTVYYNGANYFIQ